MVIALLLSDAKKPLRYQDLGRVALQCLQGVHSMWKALAILHSALPSSRELKIPARAQCSDAAPSPRILSALDPHVADSGCQTRAQMLWDLVQIYSLPDKRDSLERAMAMLEEIRLEAAKLVREIEENRGKPRSTSLFILNTHMSVWQRIGFAQFQELFSESEDDSSGASTPDSTSTNEAPSKAAPVTNSSHKRRNISVDADWDPENLFLVARFLTICFLLSEYRIAQVKPGTPMRVIFRVDLVAMYGEIERDLEGLGLLPANRDVKCFDGKAKVNSQYDTMQTYISIITADWARRAARDLALPDLNQSLSDGLIAASCRRISCIATYPSALLVRASWLTSNSPILLVIQRFCSHGDFHNVYCRISRSPRRPTFSSTELFEMGESNWFDVQVVSGQEVLSSAWSRMPHVVMICMSAAKGTTDDYLRLVLDHTQGKTQATQPRWGACHEIVDLVSKLRHLNFARFLAHCAALDEQFPFPLPDEEDAHERVNTLMQKGLGETAGKTFQNARDGAESYKNAKSMGMFAIEHIVLEYPSIVLKELREEPGIYGCKLEI